jgi:transcriptional regulator of arginine metabolism
MNIHATGDVLRRREEIRAVVRERSVRSQDELLHALRRKGFKVTQPTLSRDLRELGLLKTPSGYVDPGTLASVTPIAAFAPPQTLTERFETAVREFVLSAIAAGNLLVIKTAVAAAQPVASAIDGSKIEHVVGTIAGDDTIFLAMATPAAASALERRIHHILGHPVRRVAR